MSFNWGDYLSLANALLTKPNTPGPEEAAYRSAVSRAYYAAFCSARNFARDEEKFSVPQTAKAHQLVMTYFHSNQDPLRRKIGRNLRRLRDYRNRADYDDSLARPDAIAQASVALANQILEDLKIL